MGGQACVLYGAAEFSRDLDLLVLADAANLAKLQTALADLQAEAIAVPEFDRAHLLRGHAVHFRCRREDVAGLRIDIMASVRGLARFHDVWDRRETVDVDGEQIELLGLEDLVRAKKTQRDKDWPMIRRLVERSYFERRADPTPGLVRFWLRELRTPELLIQATAAHPVEGRDAAEERPAVRAAMAGDVDAVDRELETEEHREREQDRNHWRPLRQELEQFRRTRRTDRHTEA
jgi:hypothetical protein